MRQAAIGDHTCKGDRIDDGIREMYNKIFVFLLRCSSLSTTKRDILSKCIK